MMKKSLSWILVIAMILGAMMAAPVTVSARTADVADTGYTMWDPAYRDFVYNRQYRAYVSAGKDESLRFSLFDLDGDGVQELVVANLDDFNYQSQAYGYTIFTFKNGAVQFVLKKYLHGSISGHIRSSRYYGAFGGFMDSFNSAVFGYYYLKDGALVEVPVAAFPGNNTLTRRTSDKQLYQAFLDSTQRGTTVFSGRTYNTCTFTYRGEYSYTDIRDMGWDMFILEALFLARPTVSSAANTYGGVTVGWTAVPGAAMYEVLRKTAADQEFTSIGKTDALTFTDNTAVSGTKYTYTVRCCAAEGSSYQYYQNEYYYDTVGKTVTYIAAPTITLLNVGANRIALKWNASKGAAKYRAFVKSGSSWKKLIDTKATTYTYKRAKVGYTYTFTVRCLSSNGKAFTSGYNPTGWRVKVLAAPKITKLQSTSSGVKLTIGAVKGAAKYRVFVKSGTKWLTLGDTTGTTFIHRAAKNGKKYTYTVRCITASGQSARSAYYTKGWSITFKKPIDWSSMYYDYVMKNKDKMYAGTQTYGSTTYTSTYKIIGNTPFALHDFDLNGIPELMIGVAGARLGWNVYTIYGGKVVFAGGMGGKSTEYSNNKTYHGIFRWDSWMAGMEGGICYSYISKGKLVTVDVESFSYNRTTMKMNETIKNKTLYKVYQAGTNNLTGSNWSGIQSDGWNSFVKKYGY